MKPREIEQTVFDLEEIRIVIRAPISDNLGDFNYTRKAADNASVSEWLEQRIKPLLNDCAVVVIDGTGVSPNGRTKLSTVRASYEHNA
jgi:hypothetical protein